MSGSPVLALDPSSPPPSLADRGERERLTPSAIDAIARLAEFWGLTTAETCALLGDVSERSWYRMKGASWSGVLSQDTLTRISALIGIFKGLRLLFSLPLADEWVRLPNTGTLYGGQRPIDVMIEGGIPRMIAARRHVDALRGGL